MIPFLQKIAYIGNDMRTVHGQVTYSVIFRCYLGGLSQGLGLDHKISTPDRMPDGSMKTRLRSDTAR